MKPKQYPLKIYQGSTFRRAFKIKSRGAPADLTGFTARLQVRATADETSPVLLDLSVGAGLSIDVVGARIPVVVSGLADVSPSTADLGFDRGVYDLFIYSASGEPEVVASGPVYYIKAVTHV